MGDVKRPAHGREWYIQRDLIEYLKGREWLVERMIGNAFQKGIPDLYAFHPSHGQRWIDVKVEGKWSLTKAQRHKWPMWESFGCHIWILTGADQDNYDKLFSPCNWRDYWKDSYEPVDIDSILDKYFEDYDKED
jgi:hypothetical protein